MKETYFDSAVTDAILDELMLARVAKFERSGVRRLTNEERRSELQVAAVGVLGEKDSEQLHSRLVAMSVLNLEWLEELAARRERT